MPRLAGLTSLRWWGLFVVAGLLFMAFGVCSFSLFRLLDANLSLFVEHGSRVIADGALIQLLELIATAYGSLLLWIGFRACETALVLELNRRPRHHHPRDSV